MKRLVILGGGYGGLKVIDGILNKNLPNDIQVVLIDQMPHHGLKTEYYALAAGTEPDSVVRVPFLNHNSLQIKHGTVTDILLRSNEIRFENGETISYDWLVVGLGCTDRYHGIPGAEEYTHSIQSLSNTRRTYQAINNVGPYGDVTIVGGGLSGVELAAELKDSRPDLNIRILDRGPSILDPFPEKLKSYVRAW
ncbi:MAG: FAD-dependent oxidoreductase, partial [Bacilli bacterium]